MASLDLDQLEQRISEACEAARRTADAARSLHDSNLQTRQRYEEAAEHCLALQQAVQEAHPVLQERAKRAMVLLQTLLRSPSGSEQRHERLQSELQSLRESPLWTERIRHARRREQKGLQLLQPGPAAALVFYECAGLKLCSWGRLRYNVREADGFGRYAIERGQDLAMFPDLRSLGIRPDSARRYGMMVFDGSEPGSRRGLLYEKIIRVQRLASPPQPLRPLAAPHDAIAGRYRSGRDEWLYVKS
ncbi:MAG: hypothetical protein K1X75_16600 [Leptospirales bacterium]|nr:hypothetical protein [Leptospirales bacterium]